MWGHGSGNEASNAKHRLGKGLVLRIFVVTLHWCSRPSSKKPIHSFFGVRSTPFYFRFNFFQSQFVPSANPIIPNKPIPPFSTIGSLDGQTVTELSQEHNKIKRLPNSKRKKIKKARYDNPDIEYAPQTKLETPLGFLKSIFRFLRAKPNPFALLKSR